MKPGSILVAMEPLYKDGLEGVTPGSSCIANAYTSNHDVIADPKTGTMKGIALHVVDATGLVHALLLRIQALLLPIKTLVLAVTRGKNNETSLDQLPHWRRLCSLSLSRCPIRAAAFDLNGAWASDADNCAKVFVRKGAQVTFTEMSDVYGGGFIIEGDQITGKFARCRIKARKDDGKTINLVAACATDIMLQSVQFSLREARCQQCDPAVPGHGRHGDQIRALSGAVAAVTLGA